MSISLAVSELAARIGAELSGNPENRVRRAAPLEEAGPGDLTFLARRKYLSYLAETRASAIIVARELGSLQGAPNTVALLWVDDPYRALVEALGLLYPQEPDTGGISPTAVLGAEVELGEAVRIGPYAVLGDGVELGDRTRIGAHTVIGDSCQIGSDSEIRDQVTIHPETRIGCRCIIHSGARIGTDGYGYAQVPDGHRKIPQVGRCIVEDDVEIGANATIDRGSVGETRIGAGTKIDNLVHIAHNVRIGSNCLVVAQVGIAGSTRVGKSVVIAGQAGVAGHLTIGDGAIVAAQSGVSCDVPAGETYFGYPARPRTQVMRANAVLLKLPDLLSRVRDLERRLEEKDRS